MLKSVIINLILLIYLTLVEKTKIFVRSKSGLSTLKLFERQMGQPQMRLFNQM